MSSVAYVRLRPFGKVYRYSNSIEEVKESSLVVVEGDFGITIAPVIKLSEGETDSLKPIIRVASEEDLENFRQNLELERDAKAFCLERIRERKLPMRLLVVDCALDRRRIVFYFTAEGRIDFRELVRDLAARFRTRIEMRQIGVRDEAKFFGGIGVCGMEICCRKFLSFFKPVSLRMAKEQEVVLNVAKLSGICGRLKCCLRYEYFGEVEELIDEEVLAQEEREPEVKRFSFILNKTDDDEGTEDTGGGDGAK